RSYLERVIASLGNRIFLLHDIHKAKPLLFQSRWALSFLCGPLTREQVAELMEPVKQPAPPAIPLCTHCHAELGPDVTDRCPTCGQSPWANAQFRLQDKAFKEGLARVAAPVAQPAAGPTSSLAASSSGGRAAVLPPEVTQFYLPVKAEEAPAGATLEYQPR